MVLKLLDNKIEDTDLGWGLVFSSQTFIFDLSLFISSLLNSFLTIQLDNMVNVSRPYFCRH